MQILYFPLPDINLPEVLSSCSLDLSISSTFPQNMQGSHKYPWVFWNGLKPSITNPAAWYASRTGACQLFCFGGNSVPLTTFLTPILLVLIFPHSSLLFIHSQYLFHGTFVFLRSFTSFYMHKQCHS